MSEKPEVAPREVFSDARGPSRVLRTSWHPDEDVVVLSVWEQQTCLTTFRLPSAATPDLVRVLVEGRGGVAPREDDLPHTGALRPGPVPTGPSGSRAPAPIPAPAPAPVSASDQVRAEVQHLARNTLDSVARIALVLRDRVGRDPR